jgi:hypothetical protein
MMETKRVHDAKHWRTRAAEVRKMAEQVTGAELREAILEIAEQYERLALDVEERGE